MKRRAHTTFRDLGYSSYQEYLKGDHWQQLRTQYFASRRKRHHTCATCAATDKPLDLHHRTYIRIGRERLADLVPLCRECHGQEHKTQPNPWAMWDTHKKLRATL